MCGRALNVADPSGFVFATVLHVHEPCVYKRVYTRTTPPILLLLSSLCSSRRNVSIAALDLWVTVPSPIDTHNAALPYVGVRRAPERKSLCRLNPRNASRDPISTNPDSWPGISIASVPVDLHGQTRLTRVHFPRDFLLRSHLLRHLRKVSKILSSDFFFFIITFDVVSSNIQLLYFFLTNLI